MPKGFEKVPSEDPEHPEDAAGAHKPSKCFVVAMHLVGGAHVCASRVCVCLCACGGSGGGGDDGGGGGVKRRGSVGVRSGAVWCALSADVLVVLNAMSVRCSEWSCVVRGVPRC